MAVTLYNPSTGASAEFTERQAQVRRRHGWTDPPEESPEQGGAEEPVGPQPTYEPNAARLPADDPASSDQQEA